MKIAIIGSGIGGLAAACRLARKGHRVTVFEKNATPGGKINEIVGMGYRFDTGPSLFTLPELVNELFEDEKDGLPYHKLDILCKYFFEDGKAITAYADTDKFIAECEKQLHAEGRQIRKYLNEAATMYRLTADIFLFNSLHKVKNFIRWRVLKSLLQVHKIRFYRTMHGQNAHTFSDPRLVQLFDRYATYNGSNPYQAPATLNVIGHLENNLGAYFPKEGMYAIANKLFQLAQSRGVHFEFNTQVDEILLTGKKAIGLRIGNMVQHFDSIVSDTDVRYVAENMMEHPLKKRLRKMEPSSSLIVFYLGIKKTFPGLDLHNILFSNNYKKEFESIFQTKTIDNDPTVYIFVSSKLIPSDAPEGCENWFVMINAPSDAGQDWHQMLQQARSYIIEKINRVLQIDLEPLIEFEKVATPQSINTHTLSYAGALYGNSSNSMFAAFLRHPNFLRKIQNLYFVGGSVHPGGGIPLCLSSAKIIDQEIPTAK